MSARGGASGSPLGGGQPLDERVERRRRRRRPSWRRCAARDRGRRRGLRPRSAAALSGICLRQVDLVDDGDDLEVVLEREVRVGECLRLDALRRVDDEQRALARLQRARDLVGEVHVARRVDEVELVALPGDANGLGLDRDAALALELHRVEHLLAHLALRHRLGQLEDPVGERRLPMIDVGDDREVADTRLVHVSSGPGATRVAPAARPLRAAGRRGDRRRRLPRGLPRRSRSAPASERPSAASSPYQTPKPPPRARSSQGRSAGRPARLAQVDVAEPPAQKEEERRRPGDVDDRRGERDPPDAEPVEERVEDGVHARGSRRPPWSAATGAGG